MASVIINHDDQAPNTYAFGLVNSGTTQQSFSSVPAQRNVFTTVASGGACTLDYQGQPIEIVILNYGANTLTVFPPIGWSMNNGTVNAGATVTANTSMTFIAGDPNGSSYWYRT